MKQLHCSCKIISRSSGRSSVQMSAYISGEKYTDERTGEIINKTTKEEVISHNLICTDRVPENLRNEEAIWNSVEQIEKQESAQLCRHFDIDIPYGFSKDDAEQFAKKYAEDFIKKDGMPFCQYAVHWKDENPHVHFLTPMRDIDKNGKWEPKRKDVYKLDENGNRIPKLNKDGTQKVDKNNRKQWEREKVEGTNWNDKSFVETWRARASEHQNAIIHQINDMRKELNELDEHLGNYNNEPLPMMEEVTHLSYKRQGIERVPTVHVGRGADREERLELNKQITEINDLQQNIIQQQNLIQRVQAELQQFLERCRHELKRRSEQVRESIRARIDRLNSVEPRGMEERNTITNSRGEQIPSPRIDYEAIESRVNGQAARLKEQDSRIEISADERESRELERERLAIERRQQQIKASHDFGHGGRG